MADVVVTATSVVPVSGNIYEVRAAGVNITAGQTVYADSNNVWQLADANGSATTAGSGSPRVGIAMNSGNTGQCVAVPVGGIINPGGTLVKGTYYFVSANPGGIAPSTDVTSTWFSTRLGYAISTSQLQLDYLYSGVQL